MTDYPKALAAAREALSASAITDRRYQITDALCDLLAALDAQVPVAYRFWDTEQDRWQWGEASCAEKDDELLYAAPPAALAVPADGMLPDALAPHAKEWYRLCERRFAADRITISGKLAEAIVSALAQQPAEPCKRAPLGQGDDMSTKHTPGPWTPFILDKPLSEIPTYVEKCIAAGTGEEFFFVAAEMPDGAVDVCHVGNGLRREANARLIAAAPELLAALKEIIAAADGDGWNQLDASFATARAAIAKAVGHD